MARVILRLEDSPPAGMTALVTFDPPLPMKDGGIDPDRAGELTAVQLHGLTLVRNLRNAGVPTTVVCSRVINHMAPKGN